ncbi:MAG: hypothetical protein HC939_18645 [Pleurocapsa sp. SU_5_0]|nr:hypothetical protein [Pleurocapsa sp. SU_5_0]NJR47867.1 hypothetical protein [Hyellaceae cyanobacterium CSU_1_1]
MRYLTQRWFCHGAQCAEVNSAPAPPQAFTSLQKSVSVCPTVQFQTSFFGFLVLGA